MPLNREKLRERIESIVEQPPFHPGSGGLASTDKDSYAEARALLVLVALQVFPVMVRRFPKLRIKQLFEGHPRDGVTGVADEASVKVFFLDAPLPPPPSWREHLSPQARLSLGGGGGPEASPSSEPTTSTALTTSSVTSAAYTESAEVYLRVDIPVRSSTTGKCLEPSIVRKYMLRALLMAEAGKRGVGSEGELAAATAALEEEYRVKYLENAPRDIVHLFWMHIIDNSLTLAGEFEAYFQNKEKARVTARGTEQQGVGGVFPGMVRTETRGSAVDLWWPVPPTAITYVEMLREREELKSVLTACKEAEKGEARELRLQAALKRQVASSPDK